jgi:hypothetical protein
MEASGEKCLVWRLMFSALVLIGSLLFAPVQLPLASGIEGDRESLGE